MVKTIWFYSPLAKELGITDNKDIEVKGKKLIDALNYLIKNKPYGKKLKEILIDNKGYKKYIITVDRISVECLNGLETKLNEDSKIYVIFNIAGG